jgi:hypothetical protein
MHLFPPQGHEHASYRSDSHPFFRFVDGDLLASYTALAPDRRAIALSGDVAVSGGLRLKREIVDSTIEKLWRACL